MLKVSLLVVLFSISMANPMDGGAWWAAVNGVAKSRTWLSILTFTFHFHTLEKEMATHSSVFAWRIPGMGKPGGLPSMGSHRVGHDWSNLAAAAAAAMYQVCGTLPASFFSWFSLLMSTHSYFKPEASLGAWKQFDCHPKLWVPSWKKVLFRLCQFNALFPLELLSQANKTNPKQVKTLEDRTFVGLVFETGTASGRFQF